MSDLFPFVEPDMVVKEGELEEKEIQLAQEWAWDFKKDEFKLKNGKMYIVEKNEAIKIWIYKILKTERFKYLIYDHDYGHDLSYFIGQTGTQAYIKAEIERIVKEAILSTLEDYVLELRDFKVDIDSDLVIISFIAITIYDEEVAIDGIQIFRQN